ncbi:unnamed protein product [Schistosoma mattheei]|uniref:Uncharacterized protein n=1 Tax=Schistosoma mattheei TaxID=31246 RepID=A0A183P4X8_9TREM|nr:unnamed protein product [Schistosoma mattheei]
MHKGKSKILNYNTENTKPITLDEETVENIIDKCGGSDADVKMVARGSQQETLDTGFVLFGARQQDVLVMLRGLMLPDGFDPVSPSFAIIDVTTGSFGQRLTSCRSGMFTGWWCNLISACLLFPLCMLIPTAAAATATLVVSCIFVACAVEEPDHLRSLDHPAAS